VETLVFWALALLSIGGAAFVVFSRDMIRMVAGLGAFLLAVAGYFLLFDMPFLAGAQVFVYVGGVLVMMLFAIMAIRRDETGRPRLSGRYDILAFAVALVLFALMNGIPGVMDGLLSPLEPSLAAPAGDAVDMLGDTLLGSMLPHFELAGVLLLTALVAVLAVTGGRDEQ
jgi:NADH-quinone oxidoreductase subunit J